MKKIKLFIYYIAKYTGLFHLSRRYTKDKLRILCYHGISVDKEHETFDKLFMQFATFKQRMDFLKENKYPVLDLDHAVEKLYKKSLPPCSTVITFDDGWSGVYGKTSELLKKHNFPWTLYVTTYYMIKQTQVFNIVFQHMLKITTVVNVDFNDELNKSYKLTDKNKINHFYNEVSYLVNSKYTAQQRQDFLFVLAKKLKVDIDWIFNTDAFKNISESQCSDLINQGVDIQLHTHRHRFPTDDIESSKIELVENKEILERLAKKELSHLCYPSGEHSASQFTMMESLGIKSATTVNVELNDHNSHKYQLTRFLDGENISQIEYEAELSGFASTIRKLLR